MADYGLALDQAWAAHLAPRDPAAPTVASLFSGCGGSSLGYSMAGYRELLAVEWDDHAAAVFALNFPDVNLYHGDITKFAPEFSGIEPGSLDLLDGSPPCQGFSVNGSRRLDDPRNMLFWQFVRLLGYWQPKAFVMENVRGLTTGAMRGVFQQIMRELRGCGAGYQVVARLIDCSLVGVPQARKRVIFTGVRADLGMHPVHPVPYGRPVTVRQAIASIIDDPGETRLATGKRQRLAPHVQPGKSGSAALKSMGGKGDHFNLLRLSWDRPANTLVKGAGSEYLHPALDRLIGIREMARIQSFPDQYNWGPGTYHQIQARIGNSVPPLMMRAVATAMRTGVLDQVTEAAP